MGILDKYNLISDLMFSETFVRELSKFKYFYFISLKLKVQNAKNGMQNAITIYMPIDFVHNFFSGNYFDPFL